MKGEYVDFALLLDNSEGIFHDINEDLKLSVDDKGCFVWKQHRPKRQINSIHTWTSAYLVYASVFLSAHPEKVQEILKYAHTIRTAASRFGGWGWKTYDMQFRMRQQLHPQRSWASLDGELWALYVSSSPQGV